MTTTVTITGAAGAIGYALAFRIAAGDMLGASEPVRLRLLEIPDAVRATEGVAMELADSAFPLLRHVEVTADPAVAFEGANVALLVGARPRGLGMERADLLAANAGIFGPQGAAIAANAADDIRVLVVGNPANTNAVIAAAAADGVPDSRFTAMTRLDHNRALARLAEHLGEPVRDLTRMTVWGNHSLTQVPDVTFTQLRGEPISVDQEWVEDRFIPEVAERGATIIAARGASSAASAAGAAIDHVRDWVHGTPEGDWVSVSLPSHGEYRVPEGLVSSFPAVSRDGQWQVVDGLELTADVRSRLAASIAQLEDERDAVRALGAL